MKVLYCNPSFWEYRLPFYVELNRLFKGDFHVIYSTKRYGKAHSKLLGDIKDKLGNNAHPYDNELMFDVVQRSFNAYTEDGKQIPVPISLLGKIRKVKPDVLITEGFFQWTPWVLLYSFIFRVPVLMGYERTCHTERNCSAFKLWTRRMTDKFIAGYLVNGTETKKYLKSIGVKEDKIHIGGMSADSTGLRSAIESLTDNFVFDLKCKYKQGEGLVFLFTGRLIERKGVIPLLNAWKSHVNKYANDSLVLVGDGPLMKEAKLMCNGLNSVFLEGACNYENIYRYYAIADVYILPTIEDNWSLVIPEAMACGLPVSTSIYNGCHPELVREGENGCTFDTFDNESIVRALDYFHHVDLSSFGKKSIEIEKDYNTEACAKREFDGIMKLVAKK